jgi:hypothetical protein
MTNHDEADVRTPELAPPALIATDLDGTLLRSDGTISSRTRLAIRSAQDVGLNVAFITARPPRIVKTLAVDASLEGIAVCSNGAILYDIAGNHFLRHERLDGELAREMITVLRAREPEIVFATEHGHKLGYEPAFPEIFEEAMHGHPTRVGHALQLCDEALTKLIVHHPARTADALADLVSFELGTRAVVTHSGGPFVEIGAVGVSKASGLKHLCERLDIQASQVVAFGDMPNDLPMLDFAGHAVAVANAHPAVLAIADEVTASNDDDGVARTIERLIDYFF